MSNKKRSPCPIACTLDLVGDRWTLLVVRDMACGKSLFKEFTASPERIATNILADRLERLCSGGLAETFSPRELPNREAYRLTAKGKKRLAHDIGQWQAVASAMRGLGILQPTLGPTG